MSFPNTDQSSNTYSTNPTRGQNDFGNDNSATEFNQQRSAEQQQGYPGNTTDAGTVGAGGGFNNTEAFGARRQQAQGRNEFAGRDDFAGNTTDANTFGAGGDFGDTGRQGGQQRDQRDDNFDGSSHQAGAGEAWDRGGHEGQTRGSKPTMGERVKGTMQQTAGGITKNKGMQERGKELKQGESDQQQQY